MAAVKLPFGLRGGALTHVGEVAAGKACGCTCPGCAADLVAKKGARVAHHFACEFCVATGLNGGVNQDETGNLLCLGHRRVATLEEFRGGRTPAEREPAQPPAA